MYTKSGPEPEPESFGNSQQNSARLSVSIPQRTDNEGIQNSCNIIDDSKSPLSTNGGEKGHKQSKILQFFKQGFQAIENNSNKKLQKVIGISQQQNSQKPPRRNIFVGHTQEQSGASSKRFQYGDRANSKENPMSRNEVNRSQNDALLANQQVQQKVKQKIDLKSQEFGSIETLVKNQKPQHMSQFGNLHAMMMERKNSSSVIKEQESVFDQHSKSVEDNRASNRGNFNKAKKQDLQSNNSREDENYIESRKNKNFTTNDEFMNEIIKPNAPEKQNLLITNMSSDQNLSILDQNSKMAYSQNKSGLHRTKNEFMNQILQSCMPKPQSSHGNRMQKYYCRNIDRQKNEIAQGLTKTTQSQKPDNGQAPQLPPGNIFNVLLTQNDVANGNIRNGSSDTKNNLLGRKDRFGKKNIQITEDSAPYLFKKKIQPHSQYNQSMRGKSINSATVSAKNAAAVKNLTQHNQGGFDFRAPPPQAPAKPKNIRLKPEENEGFNDRLNKFIQESKVSRKYGLYYQGAPKVQKEQSQNRLQSYEHRLQNNSSKASVPKLINHSENKVIGQLPANFLQLCQSKTGTSAKNSGNNMKLHQCFL